MYCNCIAVLKDKKKIYVAVIGKLSRILNIELFNGSEAKKLQQINFMNSYLRFWQDHFTGFG